MKIISAIDFSDASHQVIEQTAFLAKASHGEVLLTHASKPEVKIIGFKN